MTETLETRLGRRLHDVSTALVIPDVPMAALVAQGRARVRRTRRFAVGAAAVAAVVVITGIGVGRALTGSTVTGPAIGPSPVKVTRLSQLLPGDPPRIPYLHDGLLHVDGFTIPTNADRVEFGGGTTVVEEPHAGRWLQPSGNHLVPLPHTAGTDVTIGTSDGTIVWQTNPTPNTSRVYAWDPVAHRIIATHDLPIAASCCDGPALQIFCGDGRTVSMWQPAEDAVTVVTGYGDLTPQPTAVVGRGLVFPAPTDQLANQGLIGQVDRRGYWQRVARVPDAGGHWSLDGTEVAFTVGEDGEIGTKSPRVGMVVDATQRHRVTMSFPRAYVVSGAIWESNDDVRDSGGWILLVADQSGDIDLGEQYLLRCNATTGDCAVALRYQGGPNWQFPSVQ